MKITDDGKEQEVAFWNRRAGIYQNLHWATHEGYLKSILDATAFLKEDRVLDVGTGTGLVSEVIAPFVSEVIGIDISDKMLEQARENTRFLPNVKLYNMDVRQLSFEGNVFDKVVARMVFHGLVHDAEIGIKECYRITKPGGKLLIAEGSPPSAHVRPFYIEMFKLKEKRRTFMLEDLNQLLEEGGFEIISFKEHWIRHASSRNWLNNSGLSSDIQSKIFEMHLNLDSQGKKDYNMVIDNDDCFIDMKFISIVGRKN